MKMLLNVVAAVALVGAPAVGARQPVPQLPGVPITVMVHDYSGLPRGVLHDMEGETRFVLARAGISVKWLLCHTAESPIIPEACLDEPGPGRYRIHILPEYLESTDLGVAQIEGYHASLSAARIRETSERWLIPLPSLLGYVMAHEIGHLLLGPDHSRTGIMQGMWTKVVCQAVAQHYLDFTSSERDAMHRVLRTALAVRAAEPK